jgi:glycerol kinase
MAAEVVLAVDAGTTGITALLVDHDGRVRSRGYREIKQYYPQPGWVEHDPHEIWAATLAAIAAALAQASDCRPIALGIANQRETILFWDRRSGEPVHRAIVWQCRRSTGICDELRAAGLEPEVARKTGLRFDPYFSGTKALWLCRSDPAIRRRIEVGDLFFGTIDTWLAWQFSGGRTHATDTTNASRTLAFDIRTLDWDDELLQLFGLHRAVMPDVAASGAGRGSTVAAGEVPAGLPIAALVGDQQAALFGQACFEPGQTKATYGTGCFILMATGARPVPSQHGLLTTLAASVTDGPVRYALEGSSFVAGAAVQWCRDNLGLIENPEAAERLAASVEDSGGVVFIPAFVGLGAPYWQPTARGTISGLTGATRPAHIVRAALDSIVFQAQDMLEVMTEDTATVVPELRVDGGAAANDRLMQLQADLAGVPLSRPQSIESTALGAAFLAGLTVGFWRSQGDIASLRREAARFNPSRRASVSKTEDALWTSAIGALLDTHNKH